MAATTQLNATPHPVAEALRLATVRSFELLDTPRERALDTITTLASEVFNVPIAIVTVVAEDRIWFKSAHGLDLAQIDREPGLCASAVAQDEVWIVQDARNDDRTRQNSLVTGPLGLQFYAGVPLMTADGAIGTLCLIDHSPRLFDERERRLLEHLGSLTMNLLEIRRSAISIVQEAEFGFDRTSAELQQEVGRRQLAEQRQRLLADVTHMLLDEDDIDAALETVSRRVLPLLGVGAAISRVDDEGFQTTHVSHIDPGAVAILGKARDASQDVNLDETPAVVDHVLASREPLVCTVEEALTWPGMPEAPGLTEALQQLGVAWFLIAPLIVRGRAIGAITYLATNPARRYDADDVALGTAVAERIAVAIDNAELNRTHQEITSALQSSLLPPILPRIPGLELAAQYRAAGPADIGGDFYDVFAAAEKGAWHLLLGDVSGKGAEAAAIAGLARYTARAVALSDSSPKAILEQTNTAVERQSSRGKFLTALAGTIRRASTGFDVEIADAGHPPPLIRRADGTVEQVKINGTILGIFPDANVAVTTVHLEPDDLLVVYTDGLIEARRGHGEILGLERIGEALANMNATKPANIVRLLMQVVDAVDGGDPSDDVAIMALRVRRPRRR